ncbi:DUF397 domain-containing protein [Marinactinospora rubrisoli]|uniref:DUF397 domain-containing protein n=1 Tax=Marinactinospora rubrisoli TaxID=2715399 RepID=A0ABW2KKI8_9ACTN
MSSEPEFRKSSYSGNHDKCVECASAAWTRASYSGGHGENCIECTSATWTKSSHSGNHDNCVECAHLPPTIALRDSKHPEKGHLTLPATEWSAFLAATKHDHL